MERKENLSATTYFITRWSKSKLQFTFHGREFLYICCNDSVLIVQNTRLMNYRTMSSAITLKSSPYLDVDQSNGTLTNPDVCLLKALLGRVRLWLQRLLAPAISPSRTAVARTIAAIGPGY